MMSSAMMVICPPSWARDSLVERQKRLSIQCFSHKNPTLWSEVKLPAGIFFTLRKSWQKLSNNLGMFWSSIIFVSRSLVFVHKTLPNYIVYDHSEPFLPVTSLWMNNYFAAEALLMFTLSAIIVASWHTVLGVKHGQIAHSWLGIRITAALC